MVGPMYDFLENPLGAVRLTFEKAVVASPDADPVAAFNGRDWGAVDLFREFLFEKGGISQVPFIDASSRGWIPPNSLVRFRGMVQDMFGNELYIGAFRDGSTWRTNKFADMASFPMPLSCESRFWERRLLHCIPVPGQNSWTLEGTDSQVFRNSTNNFMSLHGEKRQRDADSGQNHDDDGEAPSSSKKQKDDHYPHQLSDASEELPIQGSVSQSQKDHSFSCLVKIYDIPEGDVKLNDVFEFIGVYTFDPEIVTHTEDTEDLMPDILDDALVHLPASKVPRIHCLICRKLAPQDFLSTSPVIEPRPDIIKGIRESLLRHLTYVLGNDSLAAECLLLHLLSRLRARVDVVSVGKLSLNLTGFTRESASIYGNRLTSVIQSLFPFSKSIPLTVDYLNTAALQPRKDNQTGRLLSGVLQLAQGTHLTIDETHLRTGMLESDGLRNARLLKHLIEWQMVEYDFEYYKLEMAADVQLLILSDGKSNLLPADLVLPFRPNAINAELNAGPEEMQSWRWYLATLRSLPNSSHPELNQILQDEMVAAMQADRSLGSADLNRWLTMAQLVCASFGEKELSLEHWRMVRELERLRIERLK